MQTAEENDQGRVGGEEREKEAINYSQQRLRGGGVWEEGQEKGGGGEGGH